MKRKYLQWLVVFFAISSLTACAPIFYSKDSGLGNPAVSPSQHFYTHTIWDTLGKNFDLPDETPENPQVLEQINWYMRNQLYLIKIAEQAQPYLYYIYQQVKRRGLPAELALLPMIESSYDPFAYSKVGASGLWQMMPGTASGFGIKVDWWYDGRRDIIASTNAALDYLSYLGKLFNGQWLLAIAAYDSGEGTVNQAMQHNAKLNKDSNFWILPLPNETQSYVPKLLALATIMKHPTEYQVDWPNTPDQPYLAAINVDSQIDLSRVAKMAEMSLKELSSLNPGFNRWATDPDIPTRILLPIDKAAQFERALEDLPASDRVTWVRYQVKPSDNLLTIAKKYNTTLQLLKTANHMKTTTLHIGQAVLIPTATSSLTKIVLQSEQRYFTSLKNKLPESNVIHYEIKNGDSLDSVARKYRVSVESLRFWNGLKSTKALLVPGKELTIWPPKQKHLQTIVLTMRYQVKPGDTLQKIAREYHTTTHKILNINHLKSSAVRIGQTLRVPVKSQHYFSLQHPANSSKKIIYHVKKGDSLISIAKKTHTTVSNLTRWNRLSNTQHLKLNQALVIYRG